MISKIPWLSYIKSTESPLGVPIDTKRLIEFIRLTQNPDGFYNSLEETFFAIIGQLKLDQSSELNQSAIISHVLKHRLISGGYSSKIEGEIADIESTFYALGLLHIAGLFSEDVSTESIFCPECGEKQLFKSQLCFNCNAQITPEITDCTICNNSFQKSSTTEGKWTNLCENCQSGFLQDLEYIQNIQKQGFKEEGKKPSYKTTFFALNSLMILSSFDNITNLKKLVEFLQKNQYSLEIERIFQVLCYYLLKNEETIDFLPLLKNVTGLQHKDGGFGFDTKTSGISDTFWSIVTFHLTKNLDLLQLGPIYQFVSGLKRESDGGYRAKLMDPKSSIMSTVQSYLIFQMISDPLYEQIEESILKEASLGNKIFLAPLAERHLVSINIIESVAYQLLSKEWFSGKILDQLDNFQEYLDKSNVLTQKIGKGLIKAAMTQTEINLNEFSKGIDLANAEERVKTVIIDFLAKKHISGEIRKIKKVFIFQDVKLPRKFILLDQEVPVDLYFEEKAQIPAKREFIETHFQELLTLLKTMEEEISQLIEQGETDKARKKLEFEYSNFLNKMEKYEKKLTKIPSEFKYIAFHEIIFDFLEEWPSNKNALTMYLGKMQEKLTEKIELKEQSKVHDALLSKEQRITENFGDYIRIFSDKLDLTTQNFKTAFQQEYHNHQAAEAYLTQLNDNINALSQDISEKKEQFEGSLEVSQKPETLNESLGSLNSKIELLKAIADEAAKILKLREDLPNELDFSIDSFKENLTNGQSLINEKIANKEFDEASKELESQDEIFKKFKIDTRQKLEADINQNKATFSHFIVSFDDLRNQLASKLDQLENEWTTQKEELVSKSLEQTELNKKIQLKNKMNEFTCSQSDKFEVLKQQIEKSIKQENIEKAKSNLENAIS
jgi:prenyltransferase beta subunit